MIIKEDSRKDLLNKSRKGSRQRYRKRLNYQVTNFRGVDLSQFFNNDYFVYETPINDYVCTLAFPGVLTELREVVKSTEGDISKVNYQLVLKALRVAFDKTNDVKVNCTCADWRYRFAYWATQNGYKYGPPENRPSDETNPDDMLGATCKHLDLFLSNKRWLIKAASIVTSLIKTYPDKAEKYLYSPEDLKGRGSEEDTPEVARSRDTSEPEDKNDEFSEIENDDEEVVEDEEEKTSEDEEENI